MTEMTALFTVLIGLAFILCNIAVWSRRRLRVRVGALVTAALFLPATYFGLSEMLSRPKPVATEWLRRQLDEATVVSAKMEEGEAIYVWLAIDGTTEPRAYALPWNESTARQLFGAQRNAEANGTRVRMRKPFELSMDKRERVFYAAPHPPPPEKQQTTENPLRFQRSQPGPSSPTN